MLILGSCVALQISTAVVPFITRRSVGGTEMTVLPEKEQSENRQKSESGSVNFEEETKCIYFTPLILQYREWSRLIFANENV